MRASIIRNLLAAAVGGGVILGVAAAALFPRHRAAPRDSAPMAATDSTERADDVGLDPFVPHGRGGTARADSQRAGRAPAIGDVAIGTPSRDTTDGSTTPIPTAAELAELRAALIVPVVGVARTALRDSFEEPRGDGRTHEALDILAPRGTPVRSATDGRLLKLFTSDAGGLMVYALDASGRFILMYGHLDGYAPGLREGMPLRQGQPLGTVGTTGNAPETVPHLHFVIARAGDPVEWWRGTPVDPYGLLAR